MLKEQPTSQPTRKVAAGGLGGSLTLVVVWLIGVVGVDLPPEVASAVTVLVTYAVSWFVKDRA